jgi:hypothetical protein
MHFPANAGLIFLTDKLTNDRYLVDTGRPAQRAASRAALCPLVWVRRGGVPALQSLYDGPYAVLHCGPPALSPSESGHGTRWLPSAALRPAWQWTPCLAARVSVADRRAHAQAVLPQPSASRFQTCWFLHLLLLRHCHETVPEPFSYPARRFLHARDQLRLHSLHRRRTRPVNGHCPRG